jgi:peptidyl-prolyl cis-trans isomerase B (cyclophilin B)
MVFVFIVLGAARCGERLEEAAILESENGVIVIRFFEDVAPEHVDYFKKLSRSGFYDGTCFQRVVPGDFVVGGDPESRAESSKEEIPRSDYKLRAELSQRKHRRGIVSMARGRTIDSSGSQFFICLRELPHLDGLFTVFGEVIQGMDVVDRIGAAEVDSAGRPVESTCLRHVSIEPVPTVRHR